MKYWVAIPAAGQGQRLGSPIPKQYLELAGRTVIEWALLPFLLDARCQGIAVAVAAADSRWHAIRERIGARFIHAQGGAERSDSVAAALDALARQGADPAECVLVHDAVKYTLSSFDNHAPTQGTRTQAGLFCHMLHQSLVVEQGLNTHFKIQFGMRTRQHAIHTALDQLARCCMVKSHDGQAGSHGLQGDIAIGFGLAGKHENIGTGVMLGQ